MSDTQQTKDESEADGPAASQTDSSPTESTSSAESTATVETPKWSNDSISKTLSVSFLLCIVCSVFVSTSAVVLKSRQQSNKLLEKQTNVLIATGVINQGDNPTPDEIQLAFGKFEPKVVSFETGEYVDVDPSTYDQKTAAKDPTQMVTIPPDIDVASVKTRAPYGLVYLDKGDNGELRHVVLPVHGYGLWSTMYGYLALQSDLTTVTGFVYYQHGETPGLGGEVDSTKWKAQWNGKKIFDDEGNIEIKVLKGLVNRTAPGAEFQADGLAGATITTRGIDNTLHYWLGAHAFGPFLDKLKAAGE